MNRYLYTDSEPIYYILCSFNKLKLDKKDINLLSKVGFCKCCLKILSNKIISNEELEYINWNDWDNFLEKYPMRKNQCNCTKCQCGLNKILDVHYDLFDIEEKNPICYLSCSKCSKLILPTTNKVKTIETNNSNKRICSDIENINFNKKFCNKDLLIRSRGKNIINIDNHLIYG